MSPLQAWTPAPPAPLAGAAEEDSEAVEPAGRRARRLLDEVAGHPLRDDQAVELARAYSLLAIADAIEQLRS